MRRQCIVVGALSLVLVPAACGGGGDEARQQSPSTVATTGLPATTTTLPPARTLTVVAAPWQLPAPTSREVVLDDNGTLVVLGGQDANHASTAAVTRIDPATGAAQSGGSLDPAVHDAAGVQLAGASVVMAGGTPPARATVQAISPGQPTRALGQLPEPRTDHVAGVVNGTILVLGGAQSEGTPLASVVASTDGITWRAAGSLAEGVRYPAIAVTGGAVFLLGGVGPASPDSTAVQRYDPATGTTQVVARLPAPLSHATAFVIRGQVFVVGGFVSDQPSTQVLRFDPATNTVEAAGALPLPVTDAGGVVVGDTGYLVGGEGPGRTTTATVLVVTAS